MNHILIKYTNEVSGVATISWVLLETKRDVLDAIDEYFENFFGPDAIMKQVDARRHYTNPANGHSVIISSMEMIDDTDAYVMRKYIQHVEL